jgi:hypothetical protein
MWRHTVKREVVVTVYSQAKQDEWILFLFGGKRDGTFADIGAGHPEAISNTVALERDFGWRCLLCDIEYEDALRASRQDGNDISGDAFIVDWLDALQRIAKDGRIDYLSLDLEPPGLTLLALALLPLDRVRFNAITIEHDVYRGFDQVRLQQRLLLERHGYQLILGDVKVETQDGNMQPFEDWWVDPQTMNVETAKMHAQRLHDAK